MARELAPRLNPMIAPTLNYGVTGGLDAFPGNFSISEETYAEFIREILTGYPSRPRTDRLQSHVL